MLEDFGSGMEVVELKERVEKLEAELQGERELLREQKVKAEEARAQASSLQCQVDEMRGATSVDDSALMEEEVTSLSEKEEQVKLVEQLRQEAAKTSEKLEKAEGELAKQ